MKIHNLKHKELTEIRILLHNPLITAGYVK